MRREEPQGHHKIIAFCFLLVLLWIGATLIRKRAPPAVPLARSEPVVHALDASVSAPLSAGFDASTRVIAPALLRVDPNRASASELEALPAVGPALAERVLALRRTGVVFRKPADLRRVRGIGPHTLRTITPFLVFEQPNGADAGVTDAAVRPTQAPR